MLDYLLTLAVMISHGIAARRPVRALRQRRLPAALDFTVLSAFLYYDLGLIADLVTGKTTTTPYFTSVWQLDAVERITAFALIGSAPWLIRAGELLVASRRCAAAPRQDASKLARAAFLSVAMPVGLFLSWWSLTYFPGRAIWETRANIGLDLGLYVVLLYLPLHMLAFYIQRPESKTRLGTVVSLILAAFAIVATLPIGQRTNALLPILMLVIFWRRPSPRTMVAGAGVLLMSAALLLPIYKWQFAGENSVGASDLLVSTVNGDVGRVPVLAESLSRSSLIGSEVTPYLGAGYVYTALFFVPRSMVPSKGYATAIQFTAAVVNQPADVVNWRFGVGVVEEALLSVGLLLVPLLLCVFGVGISLADGIAHRVPSLRLPVSLAALWSFGYDSASLLLMFGTMAAVCVGLEVMLRALSHRPYSAVRRVARRGGFTSPVVVQQG